MFFHIDFKSSILNYYLTKCYLAPKKLTIFVLICTMISSIAWSEDVEKAVVLSDKAKAAYAQGKVDTAIELYQEAIRNFKHPDLLLRLANLYKEKRNFKKAFQACSEALRSSILTAETTRKANECVQESEVSMQQIWAYVESNPKGAKIRLDGRSVGNTPWKGILSPGRRQFDLELDGYQPNSRAVNAVPGAEVMMKVRLIPLGLGGLLSIETVPAGASVMLDTKFIGNTPINSFPTTSGGHDLQIILNGYLTEKRNVYVSEGRTTESMVYLNPVKGRISAKDLWPAWTLIGLGVVTATLGGVFGYQALDARKEANLLASSDATGVGRIKYDQEVDNMNTYRTTSDILWITSVVALSGGFTWWGVSR